MGESSEGDASFVKDDLLDCSEEPTLIEPLLKETPFNELYGDGVVVAAIPSIEHIDPIRTESLDLAPISSFFLPTTPSHLHAFYESVGDIRGYIPSFDPYSAYL